MPPDALPEFETWLPATSPDSWTWDWPHQMRIYEKLRMITEGSANRLMIFMPPRHTKSETVTVRYTAWRLVRDPAMNIILGCYNQRLANRFSRKIRRIAGEFIPLSRERKAVDEWETAAGGGLAAAGVGSGVTGFGAHLVVIDDPVKSRAEAESRACRERTWDWFSDDVYTRLEPGASIVLIQTRWHEDDLAGRLLMGSAEGGERWEVLSLPALAESAADPLGRAPGEPLCPERYGREALGRIRKKLGSYAFSALYQQRPVPREGGLFKRAWFREIADRAPAGLRWCRGYDLAISTKTSADFTASFRCAKDSEGNLYIAEGFRERIEFPEQRQFVIGRMRSEKDTIHAIEAALHGRAFVQDLRRDRSLAGVPLRLITPVRDKFTRALAWAGLAEEGKVRLVRGSWIGEFISEAAMFPGGRHDDQIDAVSLAVEALAQGEGSAGLGF